MWTDLFKKRTSGHFSSFQVICLGFLLVIAVGCVLLMLPISARGDGKASFFDALFTAVSAVCVTGLVVQDTATFWSPFGQAVILSLIQIGGMGVITIAVLITKISGKKIGLMQRGVMQDSIAAPQIGGIVRLTGFIVKTTVLIELAGAAVMAPVFCGEFGIAKGLWYALFHSVSAFCNAGFDLMGAKEPFSSLTSYAGQPVINLAVMLLIIIGGISFLVWDDVRTHGIHFQRYRLQSKLILIVSAVLIVFPALFFFLFEFSSSAWDDFSLADKIWMSLFQAVAPRTAGFNTADLSSFSEGGQAITIALMLIGGSPGSTAGGMKTTTVAVLFFSSLSVFLRKEDTECLGRRISAETVRNAAAILLLYLALLLFGGVSISLLDGLPISVSFFEAASAVGTVGLTLGVTTKLCAASRMILMFLMFFGRIGGLTLIFAALSPRRTPTAKKPLEKVTVG